MKHFCTNFSQGNRAKFWKTTLRSVPGPSTFFPATMTSPEEVGSIPAMHIIRVVFPQPLGPEQANKFTCPRLSKLIPLRTSTPPVKDLLTFFTSISDIVFPSLKIVRMYSCLFTASRKTRAFRSCLSTPAIPVSRVVSGSRGLKDKDFPIFAGRAVENDNLLAMKRASSILCVTKIIVFPVFFQMSITFSLHGLSSNHIKRPEGFVHEQHRRLDCQGPRHGYSLPHAL